MANCEVTPDNNVIDYVCGIKSKGGVLRKNEPLLPLPPRIEETEEDASSFIEPLPQPPSDLSELNTSDFMSDDNGDAEEELAQPEVINGVTIHHYPQLQSLTVPGTHAYAQRQVSPSNQKANTVLPPLIPLIHSYQGQAMRQIEKLIQEIEHENARIATPN